MNRNHNRKSKAQHGMQKTLIMCLILILECIVILGILIYGEKTATPIAIPTQPIPTNSLELSIAPTDTPNNYIEPSVAPTATPEPMNRAAIFQQEIVIALQGQLGENESFTQITLNDKNVYIAVDLSMAKPSLLTLAMLAENRTASITDAFLEIYEYDDLWDSVTVDFGDIGTVTFFKNDILVNEYNMRYFDINKYHDFFN